MYFVISIHALLTEGDKGRPLQDRSVIISIHALLTEGDFFVQVIPSALLDFNPRPPHGGRRFSPHPRRRRVRFQSTPSSRRATNFRQSTFHQLFNFNPRPPHGGRPFHFGLFRMLAQYFNPRPPHGGRHDPEGQPQRAHPISIHALLTEGDRPWPPGTSPLFSRFQSTPSSRRATFNPRDRADCREFQSTPSSRRATPLPPGKPGGQR